MRSRPQAAGELPYLLEGGEGGGGRRLARSRAVVEGCWPSFVRLSTAFQQHQTGSAPSQTSGGPTVRARTAQHRPKLLARKSLVAVASKLGPSGQQLLPVTRSLELSSTRGGVDVGSVPGLPSATGHTPRRRWPTAERNPCGAQFCSFAVVGPAVGGNARWAAVVGTKYLAPPTCPSDRCARQSLQRTGQRTRHPGSRSR